VAHERDPAVLADVVGRRLADVVKERAEAERLPARELVRQRLVEDPTELAGGLCLELDQPLEHLERVAVDVRVVEVALVHVVEVRQLRQNRGQEAEAVRQREALDGPGRQHEPAQLREYALARCLRHTRGRGGGEALRLRIE
jgi:hypothetical protein